MKERFEEYLGEQVGSRPLNNFSIDKLLSLSIETDNNLPFKKKQVLVRFEPRIIALAGVAVVLGWFPIIVRLLAEKNLNPI